MKLAIFCTLLFLMGLEATERAPWFPRYLELQPRMTWRYQGYHKINRGAGHAIKHRSSNDLFLTLSLGGSYKRWALELETSAGATRHRMFTPSDISFTGRYQILDDVSGEAPISLTTGATVTQVFKLARNDVSNFYQGGIQLEAHLAAGREKSFTQFWTSRYWGVLGFGIADLGSPWVRANLAYELNCYDRHRVICFAESLWGLGHKHLNFKHHFRGYGPIRYQSIDLGVMYTYFSECGLITDLGYAYRIYACNCPMQASQVIVSFLYPFGL